MKNDLTKKAVTQRVADLQKEVRLKRVEEEQLEEIQTEIKQLANLELELLYEEQQLFSNTAISLRLQQSIFQIEEEVVSAVEKTNYRKLDLQDEQALLRKRLYEAEDDLAFMQKEEASND